MAASFAASYAKRALDQGLYEQLDARFGKQLRGRFSPKSRRVVEAILYAINAIVDSHLSEGTALAKFIREVATDAPSELGARLVNGKRAYGTVDLTDLDEQELMQFLDWYEDATEGQRKVFISYTKRLTLVQLGRFLSLNPKVKDQLLRFAVQREQEDRKKKPLIPRRIRLLDQISDRMEGRRRREQISWNPLFGLSAS
jgi:hypothetical protein